MKLHHKPSGVAQGSHLGSLLFNIIVNIVLSVFLLVECCFLPIMLKYFMRYPPLSYFTFQKVLDTFTI